MRVNLIRRGKDLRGDSGVTMVELMIAGVVMVVGFLGLMVLITTAIATNNRNKMDTNATLVAQMVMEEIKSNYATGVSPVLTDCAGNSWTIAYAPGGAAGSSGIIDFSESSPPTNYFMNYTVCTANGGQATYDVRWRIRAVTANTSVVTISSKTKGGSSDLKYFALPVTLRGYAGL